MAEKLSYRSRPKAAKPTTDKALIQKATREHPVKLSQDVTPGSPDYGIVVTVPDPSDLDLGALNTITTPEGFIGRAVLMPPGTVDGVPNVQYTFVVYVSYSQGPTAVFIPADAGGVLFADLPNGVLPPQAAVSDGLDLFGAISSALQHQVGPTPPDGTGNGAPH